ncbi:MAG: hypothetical protein ACI4AH_03870 [Muribaculaceae bacterium]
MFFIQFLKWQSTKLSDISQEAPDYTTGETRHVSFINWCGPSYIYASFQINRIDLPSGKDIISIMVAHEGDWLSEEGMSCNPHYRRYEDVQEDLGKGLIFRQKGFSEINCRSLFLFDIDKKSQKHILAVPATGEEIYFEIYGVDTNGDLVLLDKREL